MSSSLSTRHPSQRRLAPTFGKSSVSRGRANAAEVSTSKLQANEEGPVDCMSESTHCEEANVHG